jgi:hypothetical protein
MTSSCYAGSKFGANTMKLSLKLENTMNSDRFEVTFTVTGPNSGSILSGRLKKC